MNLIEEERYVNGNQPYVLSQEEGTAVWFVGTPMIVKATGETTSQGFALIEQVLPPGFAPPSISITRRMRPSTS